MYSFWRPTYAEFRKELDNNPGVWSFKRHLHRRNPFLGWIKYLRNPTVNPRITIWDRDFQKGFPGLELVH